MQDKNINTYKYQTKVQIVTELFNIPTENAAKVWLTAHFRKTTNQ